MSISMTNKHRKRTNVIPIVEDARVSFYPVQLTFTSHINQSLAPDEIQTSRPHG